MERTKAPIEVEHPPPSFFYNRIGFPFPRIFRKTILIFCTLFSLFYVSHLSSGIEDLSPGVLDLILGNKHGKESMVQEIFAVLDRQVTDLASVTKEALAEVIYEEASRYNHDPKLILACIAIESSFRNWSVSERGAKGLMQIMPYVAESLAQNLGIEWMGDRTLFNPFLNIKMGMYYLSQLLLDFDDLRLALTAYNYGPTYVKSLMERNEKIPSDFYRKVFEVYQTL